MKNYITLIFIFVSFIAFAYSGLFEYDLIGGTQLNGSGCVCHTVERDTSVTVWIEGPDTLYKGQTGLYRMYLANGPAEAGGHNVAGRFGTMSLVDTFSVWDYRSPNELTQAFPLVFPTPQDTIFWNFAYTAPDSVVTDTLYSCGLSLVYDHIPDFLDRWNFGAKFPIVVIEDIVPVEFVSFTSSINKNRVLLFFSTATETNNSGFEIQRRQLFSHQCTTGGSIDEQENINWKNIGFVIGAGTTTETKIYSFKDNELGLGSYQYRLKQIDFNGSFEYSNIIEIEIASPFEFTLKQNYPNPFNPSTKISWQSPVGSWQTLKVYDLLGNEIATLVNEYRDAGNYETEFNPSSTYGYAIKHHPSSGIYFYRLTAGGFVETKKMILLR